MHLTAFDPCCTATTGVASSHTLSLFSFKSRHTVLLSKCLFPMHFKNQEPHAQPIPGISQHMRLWLASPAQWCLPNHRYLKTSQAPRASSPSFYSPSANPSPLSVSDVHASRAAPSLSNFVVFHKNCLKSSEMGSQMRVSRLRKAGLNFCSFFAQFLRHFDIWAFR